jgi:hypothetical protein
MNDGLTSEGAGPKYVSGTSAPIEGGAGATSVSFCANTVDDDITAGNPDKIDTAKTVIITNILFCFVL